MLQTEKDQRWLSKSEVARRFGVSMRSIERWTEAGKFPAGVLYRRRWRWPIDEIECHERSLVARQAAE